MSVNLRDFQADALGECDAAWTAGAQNVMLVSATGTGKTVMLAHEIERERAGSLAIAHRQELVSQIAMSLARNGVEHRILSSRKAQASPLTRAISFAQTAEFGRPFLNPRARAGVVGVDTLLRCNPNDDYFQSVRLIVQDEAHHVQASNKWGRAASFVPGARGLYPTATPRRADGRALSRASGAGLMDAMVLAPGMRDVINMGFLCDYRIYCPGTSSLHRDKWRMTASGDYSDKEMGEDIAKSRIVGDTVQNYLRFAKGLRAVSFHVNVAEAEKQAAAFCLAGVPAAALSANSTDEERIRTIRQLATGELMVVTNVDLFGEGFDLPAIECVIFARPTASFGLYVQQFGRALRLLLADDVKPYYNDMTPAERKAALRAGPKEFGIIIDQVGNVEEHGLPDAPQAWSMEAPRKRAAAGNDPDKVPLRVCIDWTDETTGDRHRGCAMPYERVKDACPFCGCPPKPPMIRNGPEHVEGDLLELAPDVLARMRGEIARIDGPAHAPHGASPVVVASVNKNHRIRQEAQRELRQAIAYWAGFRATQGDSERESYKRFWYRYGTDVASAQTLGAGEALELSARVWKDLHAAGVIKEAIE